MFLGSVCLLSLFGCIPMGPTNVFAKTQNDLGLYRGYFATALTPDPSDDLNYNSCDDRVADCTRHKTPLVDILLRLSENDEGRLQATFFRNLADLQAGVPLDLLGRGCGRRVWSLEEFQAGRNDLKRWTARFALNVRTRTCLGKLRPTSSHFLVVEMIRGSDSFGPTIDVLIDKRVVDKNYLYIKERAGNVGSRLMWPILRARDAEPATASASKTRSENLSSVSSRTSNSRALPYRFQFRVVWLSTTAGGTTCTPT